MLFFNCLWIHYLPNIKEKTGERFLKIVETVELNIDLLILIGSVCCVQQNRRMNDDNATYTVTNISNNI